MEPGRDCAIIQYAVREDGEKKKTHIEKVERGTVHVNQQVV